MLSLPLPLSHCLLLCLAMKNGYDIVRLCRALFFLFFFENTVHRIVLSLHINHFKCKTSDSFEKFHKPYSYSLLVILSPSPATILLSVKFLILFLSCTSENARVGARTLSSIYIIYASALIQHDDNNEIMNVR